MAEPEQEQEQQPEEQDLWLQIQAWAETRKRQLRLGGIGLIVAVFVAYTATHFSARKEFNANAAIFELEKFEEGKEILAVDYLKVATDFHGTTAAERALYLAAGQLFTENKYPEAQQRFEEYLAQYPGRFWATGAHYGVAAALDAQNRTDEALAAYEAVIGQAVGTSEANLAKLSAAVLLEENGKPERALKYYDELLNRDEQGRPSTWAQEVEGRKDELLRKFPQSSSAPVGVSATNAVPLVLQDATNATNAVGTNATMGSAAAGTNASAVKK
ncbi:MAG: tetratricopeptide repeat protein [Verrucomicrobiia bacterium]|jgi:TolA-binding protein